MTQDDWTMSLAHRLPSGDAGDLHLQAKAPLVTEINTHLAQNLEKSQRGDWAEAEEL